MQNEVEGGNATFYRGRVKRISNWSFILQHIMKKLENTTILLVLDLFKTTIFEDSSNYPLPCSVYWVDVVYLILLHVLEYYSQNDVESRFSVPHSTYHSVIKWASSKVCIIIKFMSDN